MKWITLSAAPPPGRRSITLALSSEEAERKAKDLARTEQDKLSGLNR
jgi:hypothetical protein